MSDKYLIEEPQDVVVVIELMKGHSLPRCTEGPIEMFKINIDHMADRAINVGVKTVQWEIWFLEMGRVALAIIAELMPNFSTEAFARFLLSKHQTYTIAPLLKWKELGIVVRLSSKIARLTTIIEDVGIKTADEPPAKTAEDILGYCVLGYLLTKRLKE